MLRLFDVTPEPQLIFSGRILGPLSDYDISGTRSEATMLAGRECLRHSHWLPWRETAATTVVHPAFGVSVPLYTDGVRVVLWDGAIARMVEKQNIFGPVGPNMLGITDWDWERNAAKVRIAPEWLRNAQDEQAKLDGLFVRIDKDKARLLEPAISYSDYIAACERILWTKPPTKRQRGVELAMALLDTL